MTNSIRRRKILKLLPVSVISGSLFSLNLETCTAKDINTSTTKVLSTWNNYLANDIAFRSLASGANIIDGIVEGISSVESDINDRSVGKGGRPDREGDVTLDACMMDHENNAGGVCFMKEIEHPIQVARSVMRDTPHVLLAGEGAQNFAIEKGHKKTNLLTDDSRRDYHEWLKKKKYKPIPNIEQHDTIGMIGIKDGKLGGGCSTSGLAYKMQGRVGDSPIIGAGLYVDGAVGACTATGLGELVMKQLSSFLVVEFMRNGDHPEQACKKAIERIASNLKGEKNDKQVGLLALNAKGEYGGFSVLPGFSYVVTEGGKTELIKAKSLLD